MKPQLEFELDWVRRLRAEIGAPGSPVERWRR
jgi:hypothetical protein